VRRVRLVKGGSPKQDAVEQVTLADGLLSAWADLPLGLAVFDREGVCLGCNRAAGELLGLDPAAVRGARHLLRMAPLADAAKAERAVVRRLEGRTVRLKADRAGAVPLLITVEDLSREAELEAELNRTQGLNRDLEDLLKLSHDHVCIADGEGRILHVTPSAQRYYGLEPEEMIGRTALELQKAGYFTQSATVMAIRERRQVVTSHVTRQGGRLIIHAVPLFDAAGAIHRVICLCRDISELNRLKTRLAEAEAEVRQYREELVRARSADVTGEEPIFRSPAIRAILKVIERAAPTDSSMLLLGESGVGKEVLVTRIHALSRRAERPLVKVNCGAIPETLIESELFGYESGAFTGARREGKSGMLELAHEGTLFLDEVAELSPAAQVKLLRAVEEKRFTRVGGTRTVLSNFRLIAATNRDLTQAIRDGRFREDLYYRLNVVPIHVPPLRERTEDIPPLAEHFLARFGRLYGSHRQFTPRAMRLLSHHTWPGNVRELENLVERLIVTAESAEIDLDDLAGIGWRPRGGGTHAGGQASPVEVHEPVPYRVALRAMERQLLELAGRVSANTYEMASLLGINQSTVVRKLRRFWQADQFPVGRRRSEE
jgi:PAS domain S-box-containing protein